MWNVDVDESRVVVHRWHACRPDSIILVLVRASQARLTAAYMC